MPDQTHWCGVREVRQDEEDRMNSWAHLPQAPYLFSWTHSLVLEEEIAIHSSILFLPEESHGQRSLVGYSPWGHKGLGTTEWLSTALFGASGKEPTCQHRRRKRLRFDPRVRRIPWRRAWQPNPVLLPGESPWSEEPGGLQCMGP